MLALRSRSERPGSTPHEPSVARSNAEVADVLDRVGALLRAQRASEHRARAWLEAASVVRTLDRDVSEILRDQGLIGLDELPKIGPRIAGAIEEVLQRGRLAMLARLEGDLGPDAIFATLPGIGAELAHRIRDTLGVRTLEELEVAAHDGRLGQVAGIGPRRAQAIRDSLDVTLRTRRSRRPADSRARPPVSMLLEIDERYRARAATRELPQIAPRRFNPDRIAWLPILHEEADGFHLHAMFSNTARAHRLDRTRDWVVIFAERDGVETQYTVVTEHRGPRAGQRVVRGREEETPPLRSSE